MRIGIIGTGRVGISLGRYLRYRNFSISGYLKRVGKENVIDLSKLGWRSFESYTEIVERSDIILIAVPDDEIIDTWNKLSKENIGEKGINDSITGPLQRGDLNTLRGHLNSQDRWERDLYLAGSRELLKIIGGNKEIEGILEEKR